MGSNHTPRIVCNKLGFTIDLKQRFSTFKNFVFKYFFYYLHYFNDSESIIKLKQIQKRYFNLVCCIYAGSTSQPHSTKSKSCFHVATSRVCWFYSVIRHVVVDVISPIPQKWEHGRGPRGSKSRATLQNLDQRPSVNKRAAIE